ncbi:hypothetical protein LINPERHAP2_LOCUS44756, partial [Linum perenne]
IWRYSTPPSLYKPSVLQFEAYTTRNPANAISFLLLRLWFRSNLRRYAPGFVGPFQSHFYNLMGPVKISVCSKLHFDSRIGRIELHRSLQ